MGERTIRIRGKIAPDGGMTDASQGTESSEIKDAAVTAAKIASNAVETAKIKDGNVTLAKLAAGVTPSHVAKFAGITAAAEDLTGTIDIAGAGILATDVASVVLRAATADVYVKKAACTAGHLTVTLSAAGGVGTQVDYVIYRAAA